MLLSDLLKSFRSTDAKQMLTPKLTLITLSFPHLSAGTAFHTYEKKLNLYLVSLQPPNYSPLSYGNLFYIHYKLFFVSSSSPFDLGQSCPWQFLVPCLISPSHIRNTCLYVCWFSPHKFIIFSPSVPQDNGMSLPWVLLYPLKTCWSPNHQDLWMWPYSEIRSLQII